LNRATVYRNVKLFLEEGWLLRLNLPSLGTLYETTGKEHHYHFYCRICDKVFEIPGCGLSEKQATPRGFITESHEVFLSGVCTSCSSVALKGRREV
jgi:Fur family ferric uptake transcriptional regulator